jgi:autotransporter-associated beta strand protein
VTANASTNTAIISGNLSLGSATRSFSIAAHTANPDLLISAVISGEAGAGITKTGTGNLRLSGTNTYSGLTTVNTSFLEISNPFALGSTASGTILAGPLSFCSWA